MLQIHLFSSSKCTQLQTHTRTHSHMRTPIHTQHACSKSPFSVYASACRCTHIHSSTHTRTHPYTRMLPHAPERCRKCMPQIHFFDSSKCLRRYTNTHTGIHACWFTHTNCTRQRLRARTRMTKCMHAPNLRFRFKDMQTDANTHIHVRTDTRTPPYTNMLLPAT